MLSIAALAFVFSSSLASQGSSTSSSAIFKCVKDTSCATWQPNKELVLCKIVLSSLSSQLSNIVKQLILFNETTITYKLMLDTGNNINLVKLSKMVTKQSLYGKQSFHYTTISLSNVLQSFHLPEWIKQVGSTAIIQHQL